MVTRIIPYGTILLLYLYHFPALGNAEFIPQEDNPPSNQQMPTAFSYSESLSQLDTVPVINPTFPETASPMLSSPSVAQQLVSTNAVHSSARATSGGWCIASSTASPTALQVALDYACGYGGADCSAIQPGASCFEPNTVKDHASYAFNDYYQKNPVPNSCVFGGTAQLTSTDPGSGNCHFTSSTTSSPNPPTTTVPAPTVPAPTVPAPTVPVTTVPIFSPPPPSLLTLTPTTIFPSPPGMYGVAIPTSLPNSATTKSCSLLLLISMIYLIGFLFASSHL